MTKAERTIARAAYAKALIDQGYKRDYCEERSVKAYPTPKKLVPNEVLVGGLTLRLQDDGGIEYKYSSSADQMRREWLRADQVDAVRTLIANPTMEVDDDDHDKTASD